MSNEELVALIKKSLKEVIKEERYSLIEILIPYVSKKEMVEIQKKVQSPQSFSETEFDDVTDWVKK